MYLALPVVTRGISESTVGGRPSVSVCGRVLTDCANWFADWRWKKSLWLAVEPSKCLELWSVLFLSAVLSKKRPLQHSTFIVNKHISYHCFTVKVPFLLNYESFYCEAAKPQRCFEWKEFFSSSNSKRLLKPLRAKKKWWNDKIKQISESTNRREDKEIQLEAAKVLRAENSDF